MKKVKNTSNAAMFGRDSYRIVTSNSINQFIKELAQWPNINGLLIYDKSLSAKDSAYVITTK